MGALTSGAGVVSSFVVLAVSDDVAGALGCETGATGVVDGVTGAGFSGVLASAFVSALASGFVSGKGDSFFSIGHAGAAGAFTTGGAGAGSGLATAAEEKTFD